MNFIIGILTFILIFTILYNYVSVSMSNTSKNSISNSQTNNQSNNQNNNQSNNILNLNLNSNQNPIQNQNYYVPIPSPIQSNAPKALNNKINLNTQTYDYSKNFYVATDQKPIVQYNPPTNYRQMFFV
jgi:hypothetical protein